MSESPPNAAFQAFQKLAEEGASFADLLTVAGFPEAPPLPDELLRRAALVRAIDKTIYTKLLSRGLKAPPFQEFTAHPLVEPAGTMAWQLKDAERANQQSRWWRSHTDELTEFSKELEKYYQKSGQDFDAFLNSLFARPKQATARFLGRYAELDKSFSLSGCEALLRALQQRQYILQPDLMAAHEDRERYLQSRTLFGEDFYRTVMYLDREEARKKVDWFLAEKDVWLLRLWGGGGVGKTVFLRWLIARRCVLEQNGSRLPVARVDLDFVDYRTLGEFPSLVFLPLMQQLTRQLPKDPFRSLLMSLRDFDTLLRRPGASEEEGFRADLRERAGMSRSMFIDLPRWLASALGTQPVLMILDTLEDMLLHHSADLLPVLQLLTDLRSRCPGLKLILSGRFDIGGDGRLPEFLNPLRGQTDRLLLGPFTKQETAAYLRDLRHIDRPTVVEAIWEKTQGHALELTLYGDLVASDPKLTAKVIRNYPEAQYARLIERIIDRIPAEQATLKWLLRYAVVPRRLDLDYVRQVINVPLTRESGGKAVQDDTTRFPEGRAQVRYGKRPHWMPLTERDLEKAWSDLRGYTAQTSWVSEEQGVIRLQPEVVEPMRSLLKQNPIYQELQVASQRYFEKLAKERDGEWGQWMEEAVYHRFQQPAAGRAGYWATQLRKARQRGYQDLEHIAGIVFGSEFLDENRKPREHIAPTAIARAAFDVAYSTLIGILRTRTAQRRENNSGAELTRRWADLKHFSKGSAARAVSKDKKDLIQAAVLFYSGDDKKRTKAIELAEAAAAALGDNQYGLAAHYLLARVLYWGRLANAEPHFRASYRLARASRSKDLPAPLADFYLARLLQAEDRLGPAARHYARAWEQTRQGEAKSGLAPAALFRRLTEIYFESGEWAKAMKLQEEAKSINSGQPWMEFQWQHSETRLQTRLGEFKPAAEACALALKAAPDRHASAVAMELDAGLKAHQYRIKEAEQLLQQAEELYGASGSPSGVATCRLKLASIYLDQCGNARQAAELLVSEDARSSLTPELFFERCRIEVRILAQTDPAAAQKTWEKNCQALQKRAASPRMLARYLVLGLALECAPREDLPLLWPLLKKLSPAIIFRTLEGFALFSGVPWASEYAPLLRKAAPKPKANSGDFQLQALSLADAFRFFGANKEALRLTESLHKTHHSAWFGRLIRALLFRLRPEEWAPDPDGLKALAAEFPEAPSMLLIASVEETTRALASGFRKEAEHLLDAASGIPDLPALARTQWSVRYFLLTAQLHRHEHVPRQRALLKARDIAGEIGYPVGAWVNEWLRSAESQTTLTEAQFGPAGTVLSVSGSVETEPAVAWRRGERGETHQCEALRTLITEPNSSRFLDWFLKPTDRAAQLAELVGVRPELLAEPPVAISTPNGILSGIPWELAFPQNVLTHRLPQGGLRLYDTVVALQRALLRRGRKLSIDGILGPQTSELLREFGAGEPAQIRRELLVSGTPSSPVLIVQRDSDYSFASRSGHAAENLRAADLYLDLGVSAQVVQGHDQEMLHQAIVEVQPGIIHFVSGFWQDRRGEIMLDLGNPNQAVLPAQKIASMLLSARTGGPRPVLIVETVTPPDEYEYFRQGLCRNWFCADLMSAARPKAIFATGLAERGGLTGFLRGLIACICRPSTLADLAQQSPRPADWPPALFTSDTGLPLWEEPPYGNDPR